MMNQILDPRWGQVPVTGGAKTTSPQSRPASEGILILSQDTFTPPGVRFAGTSAATSNPLLDPALSLKDFQARLKATAQHPQGKYPAMATMSEVLDEFLAGRWTEATQPGKKALLLEQLRTLIGPRGQGNIVMAQINPVAGDIEGNAKQIMAYLDAAEAIGVDMVVFPEMSLMGYPIYDTIKRHPFLVKENLKWLQAIQERTGKTRAVIGFVEPRHAPPGEKVEGKEFYNAMAIVGEGKLEGVVRKSLLPTYGEFNDYRTFEFSNVAGVQAPETLGRHHRIEDPADADGALLNIHGKTYGFSVCEDIWNFQDWMTQPYYQRNPILEVAKHKPDALINISASPSRGRKEQMKHAMLSYIASHPEVQAPVVYVNQNGSIDESAFEGASRVYTADGRLQARAKSFANQFLIVNPFEKQAPGPIAPLAKELETTLGTPNTFDPYDASDIGRTYDAIIHWIRDYYQKTGMKRAILGLSGGLDSSVVVTLLADALGPENVMAFSLPSKITSGQSRGDAQQLADNLGIPLYEISIAKLVKDTWGELAGALAADSKTTGGRIRKAGLRVYNQALNAMLAVGERVTPKLLGRPLADTAWGARLYAKQQSLTGVFGKMQTHWGDPYQSPTTLQNIQARARALFLWSISNQFPGTMTVATSGKSELYIGYATVNGDMSGGIAPIADMPKTKVRLLARWLNENRPQKNAMPESIVTRASGAELEIDPKTGRAITAEDDNMPYEFMDEIIWRIENRGESKAQMLAETPESKFWYEKRYGISQEQKVEWVDKFFRKMPAAVFKWWILPPGPILDGNGTIMKSDYRQPITAGKIRWDGHTDVQRAAALESVRTPVTSTPSEPHPSLI